MIRWIVSLLASEEFVILRLNRLRTRLSLIFAIFSFLAIVSLSLLIGQRSIHQVEAEIGGSLGETAYLMADKLDHFMWSRYGESRLLANLNELQHPEEPERISTLVNQLHDTFPSFSWIGYTDPAGTVLASTDDILKGADISERPVYKEALKEPFIGDMHDAVLLADLLPNPTGEAMKFVDISTPVKDPDGSLIGVLATHLSWDWLKEVRDSMAATLGSRKDVEFFIISPKEGDVILGPSPMLGRKLKTDSIERAMDGKKGWVLETWADGNEYLTGYVQSAGYKDYPGLGWTILVRQPVAEAYAPARDLMRYFVIAGTLLVLLAALAGRLLAGWIDKPLQSITNVADRLRAGEAADIPQYKGISEIEILSDSLRKLVTDLTSTESALITAENRAMHDKLTHLPNRYALDAYFEAQEREAESLALLYFDLDGFKAVNDTYGHPTGDQLLQKVAERVSSIAGPEDIAARIGGDEFVVVLRNRQHPESAGKQAGEDVIRLLNEPVLLDAATVHVGCSAGLAIWTPGTTISSVIRAADERLYKAKRAGKNRLET
ncbi:diguanylate cyclase [Sporosarcina sp. NCCP-2716]|uniref:sensor domain-containing diguanylate cyclase n=1 Tax=Sporosarcina sp. NCCP-2716 TaxID=2943679 RepID=UPI002040A44A|nr:sensor domain-containing diguanylate cyclase [Sporosarcina sp. NCCP-2716]GKV70147.1 diguanylate cyclase [Sporosarcina sp. NCCP-2716]